MDTVPRGVMASEERAQVGAPAGGKAGSAVDQLIQDGGNINTGVLDDRGQR